MNKKYELSLYFSPLNSLISHTGKISYTCTSTCMAVFKDTILPSWVTQGKCNFGVRSCSLAFTFTVTSSYRKLEEFVKFPKQTLIGPVVSEEKSFEKLLTTTDNLYQVMATAHLAL